MTPEALATDFLAAVSPVLQHGADALAGTILKDAWEALKTRLKDDGRETATVAFEKDPATPSEELHAATAEALQADPVLAEKAKVAIKPTHFGPLSVSGGIAVGQIIGGKIAIVETAQTVSL